VTADGPGRTDTTLSDDRLALYEKLRRITDPDALHQLIAAHGAEILEKGLPYILIAARNWRRNLHRQAVAHPEVPVGDLPADPASSSRSVWDPYERLAQKEGLRALAHALAQLDEADFLVVWRHAEGEPDTLIQQEWDAVGFEPRRPSVEYLRKRRQRAREQLRALLGRAEGS
jgi:hypothetical protein